MKRIIVLVLAPVFFILMSQDLHAGNGYMGGQGNITVEEESEDEGEDEGGIPDSVEGPLNEKGADTGALFGDLYKILRYQGGESYTVYQFEYDDTGRITGMGDEPVVDTAIGGMPVLSEERGYYAQEVINGEDITYISAVSDYPSQCVQPVADFEKWGDIGYDQNRIPLIITYDATWTRSECEVGLLIGEPVVNPQTGEFETPFCYDYDEASDSWVENSEPCIEKYFVRPTQEWGGLFYCEGILWTDLVDEVHFGRLNLSRSPEAVLQSAFDEAIQAINNASSISRDAAGRLLLTTDIYEELPYSYTEDGVCEYSLIETVTKAIDSPLENLALYVKIMKDGHLITAGDERAPIDRSDKGGIPLWKLLELSDGPSDDLRPTVDINKLSEVFPELVDASDIGEYVTYYECYDSDGAVCDCLCEEENPDGEPVMVACDAVADRVLRTASGCPSEETACEGPWIGIMSASDGDTPSDTDFDFAAAFLAAAADKTGEIGVDMVVYLNSILGINQVIGYSEYDDDGNPTEDADNYYRDPVYFNYSELSSYDRGNTLGNRGDGGRVTVLVPHENDYSGWIEDDIDLMGGDIEYREHGRDADTGQPTNETAEQDILGFGQMADDDLKIIEFIHRYQIPELR